VIDKSAPGQDRADRPDGWRPASEAGTAGGSSTAAQVRAREAATKLYEEHGTSIIQMRSCWNCNEAHEHLKDPDAGVISCFVCGHFFYDGQDITEEADDDAE
jgi:hypothetical protein